MIADYEVVIEYHPAGKNPHSRVVAQQSLTVRARAPNAARLIAMRHVYDGLEISRTAPLRPKFARVEPANA
jgi:hypothetical protein